MARSVSKTFPGFFTVKRGCISQFVIPATKMSMYWTRPDVTRTPHQNSGWRQPTPYYSRRETAVGPVGVWRDGKSSGGPWAYEGDLMGGIPDAADLRYPPPYSAALMSRAIIDALSNLKNQRVNLAQAFAERAQAGTMIANNVTKLATVALALKRGDYLKALRELGLHRTRRGYQIRRMRAAKSFAQRWLELQYGWKPLLSDMYGVLAELGETESSNPLFITVRGTASEQWQEIRIPVDNVGTVPCTITATKRRGCKVVLTYVPQNDLLKTVSSIGLTNPLMLQWELLPFSFVVDWCLPIGDIFNIADADLGFSFLGGSITQRSVINTVYGDGESPDGASGFNGYGFYKAVFMDREAIFTSPLPTSLPPIKNPFSGTHVANALALLVSAFGR